MEPPPVGERWMTPVKTMVSLPQLYTVGLTEALALVTWGEQVSVKLAWGEVSGAGAVTTRVVQRAALVPAEAGSVQVDVAVCEAPPGAKLRVAPTVLVPSLRAQW